MGLYLLSDRVVLHGEQLAVTPAVIHVVGNEIVAVTALDRDQWTPPDPSHDVIDVGARLVTVGEPINPAAWEWGRR